MLKAMPLFVRTIQATDLGVLARTVYNWQCRAEQRHHLASLDDRMLRDVGLDRAAAKAEVSKPFWIA